MKNSRRSNKLTVTTGIGTESEATSSEMTIEELCREDPEGAVMYEHVFLHNRHFISESDRALGVLAPAFLDELLTRILRSKLLKIESTDKLLSGERGALAAFSAKIDMVNSLGIIDELTWSNLHTLRKIRNDFAHHVDIHDFSSDTVLDKCKNLKFLRSLEIKSPKDARYAFTTCIWLTSLALSKALQGGT